jgi:hypothetical protein
MPDHEYIIALSKIIEKAKNEPLTNDDMEIIIKEFNGATGSLYDRSVKTVRKVINPEINRNIALMDDLDRLLEDLKNRAKNW